MNPKFYKCGYSIKLSLSGKEFCEVKMDSREKLNRRLSKIPGDVLQKIDRFARKVNESRRSENDPYVYAVYFKPSAELGEGTVNFAMNLSCQADLIKNLLALRDQISIENDIDIARVTMFEYSGTESYGFQKELCLFDYFVPIPKDLIHKVDEFAKAYNNRVEEAERIQVVYFGRNDVSESKKRLFLITDQVFPKKLEDTIKDSELVKGPDPIALQIWPCSYERAEHPNFQKVLDYVKSQ